MARLGEEQKRLRDQTTNAAISDWNILLFLSEVCGHEALGYLSLAPK